MAKVQAKRSPNRPGLRTLSGESLSGSEGVCGDFSVLGVEIAVESVHGSLKDDAAIGAAFKVTLDLRLNNRRQTPL